MKYADLIRAVLDGKRVQSRRETSNCLGLWSEWAIMLDTPLAIRYMAAEYPFVEFRLEPPPPVDVVKYIAASAPAEYDTLNEAKSASKYVYYKRTYDGETGQLKSSELVGKDGEKAK